MGTQFVFFVIRTTRAARWTRVRDGRILQEAPPGTATRAGVEASVTSRTARGSWRRASRRGRREVRLEDASSRGARGDERRPRVRPARILARPARLSGRVVVGARAPRTRASPRRARTPPPRATPLPPRAHPPKISSAPARPSSSTKRPSSSSPRRDDNSDGIGTSGTSSSRVGRRDSSISSRDTSRPATRPSSWSAPTSPPRSRPRPTPTRPTRRARLTRDVIPRSPPRRRRRARTTRRSTICAGECSRWKRSCRSSANNDDVGSTRKRRETMRRTGTEGARTDA